LTSAPPILPASADNEQHDPGPAAGQRQAAVIGSERAPMPNVRRHARRQTRGHHPQCVFLDSRTLAERTQTVCGTRSLWCRDCADAWRETCLGPIPTAGDSGNAAGLEIIDAQPCPMCGGLERWQALAGGGHCSTCSPATPTGERLRRLAAELRERYPVAREANLQPQPVTAPRTWPPAVPDGILADRIPTCSDCGRPRSVVPGQPGRPSGLCFACWGKRR